MMRPPPLERYQQDPGGFCTEVLGVTYSPDMLRIMESVRDNRVTVVRSANSVGKTICSAWIALWFYLCWPQSKVHTLAAPPKGNLETKLWGEINKIKLKKPALFAGMMPGNLWLSRQKVRRDAVSFLEGIPVPQDADPHLQMASISGSHAPDQLYLVDEGDGVDDAAFDGIDTCMTGPHERMLICYNPRQEVGRPWKLEVEQLANVLEMSALTHPHVVTGQQIWPGAVTREVTVKRINESTRALEPGEEPDGTCFELPDYLVNAIAVNDAGREYAPLRAGWRKVLEYDFWHVVLGKFAPTGSERHYFDRAWLAGRKAHWGQRGDNGTPLYAPAQIIRAHQGKLRTHWELYEMPEKGHRYVLGADCADGIIVLANKSHDADYHSASIYDRDTLRKVASGWGREDCTTEQFADDLYHMAEFYNEAYVIIEINNHGRTTFQRLQDHYRYKNLYYRKVQVKGAGGQPVEHQKLGFETSHTSKIIRDNYLQGLIVDAKNGQSTFDVRGDRCIDQLMQYVKMPGATAGAAAGHDDDVTSTALCALVLCEEPLARRADIYEKAAQQSRRPAAFGNAEGWKR